MNNIKMNKNIVFCCDGTWNSPTILNSTNVFKLFTSLYGNTSTDHIKLNQTDNDTIHKLEFTSSTQCGLYVSGIGTGTGRINHIMYGILGIGVLRRILLGYIYICRHYTPGDHIVLVGFSRGAYCVRALNEMICTLGLMSQDMATAKSAHYDAFTVWKKFRQISAKCVSKYTKMMEFTAALLPEWLHSVTTCSSVIWGKRKITPLIRVNVHAVAIFDTVAALGTINVCDVLYSKFKTYSGREDYYKYATDTCHVNTCNVFHAVSCDEIRWSYAPIYIDPVQLGPGTRLVQQLFPGNHSDVGGGWSNVYDPNNPHTYESALSDVVLVWMMNLLTECGAVYINPDAIKNIYPNPRGLSHHMSQDIIMKPRNLPQYILDSPSDSLTLRADENLDGISIYLKKRCDDNNICV